ncbi:phenylalanine 4-monooxygenase [Rhodohalobacter mucosus]|uniref:Phenylalanine 4-monooxygenase n=1 Tax=Rhodohalobacter mucosus TaxID=2079485 RepID=A0A316TRD7_9BACT|nr:phenylalanine 4-monooxygenase [Rhodohalobacter mucosus]
MRQDYSAYTNEDFTVWRTLFSRQAETLKGRAHPEYMSCLEKLGDVLNADKIPDFDELNEKLMAENGWSIVVVPGLIPVDRFFKLLSEKKFCSSTWLRSMDQLDYLEEPDMFHDIFGHVPLLMNPEYAKFVEGFGRLGVEYGHNKTVERQLQRLYWFTIEFGLIKLKENTRIYGAGIISSSGETKHIFEDDIDVHSYNADRVLHTDFITSEIQTQYFEITSFEELYLSVSTLDKQLGKEVSIAPAK